MQLSQHIPISPTDPLSTTCLKDAYEKGYNSITIPLTNDAWKKRWSDMCVTSPEEVAKEPSLLKEAELWRAGGTFKKDEVNVTNLNQVEYAIGMVSDWLELDSPDEWIRYDSEMALRQELSYASYLNVHTVILPPPRNREHVADYARAINASLLNMGLSHYLRMSIRVPLHIPTSGQGPAHKTLPLSPSSSGAQLGPSTEIDFHATWEMWDVIKTICDYNPRLSLTLDLTPPLPSGSETVLSRWFSEPARFIFLPASTFVPNTRGYPVLPKQTQSFIRDMNKLNPTIIISSTQANLHKTGGELAYPQYVRHLEQTSSQPSDQESLTQGYYDYLQAPLQPLMDNLQGITYEVFEKDPVKYRLYEEAIFFALCDRPEHSRTVICVAGAGRGPIVDGCLQAVTRSTRKASIYALEKNPNAFVTLVSYGHATIVHLSSDPTRLQERKANEWSKEETDVTLVFGDMRISELPEQCDIVVSELLGSFGDNELSPECLDGAMRFLKPDGISIPSSYTAHIGPLSSSKLHNEVMAMATKDGDKAKETPFVVLFQAVTEISDDGGGLRGQCGDTVQVAWEFEHPRKDVVLDPKGLPITNTHNIRSAHLTFHIPHASTLHGLAGYFEAVLYGDIGLSIHPQRKDKISPDMFSWFPIFFPFKDPLYLPAKSELDVYMWRLTTQSKVWYEWYAESFLPVAAVPSPPTSTFSPSPSLPMSGSQVDLRVGVPSPLVDAPWDITRGFKLGGVDGSSAVELDARVKIGQTNLHNPGGRSSSIGL